MPNELAVSGIIGFTASITTVVWIGCDEKKSQGAREWGYRAAFPIGMDFMQVALAGKDRGEFQPLPDLPPRPVHVDTIDTEPAAEESH